MELFSDERLISRLADLSAVVIRMPSQIVHAPGVRYALLKQLAFANINVVEVVST